MRLLLDTHAFLWWVTNDRTLRRETRDTIAEADVVVVSAASAWEIAVKRARGRLNAPDDLEQQLERHEFVPLDIDFRHARAAGALPRHHGDPFDRMLVAQAQLEGLTLVTRHARLALYGVATLAA
jgi:PIN domain nuclease of toxin-antitoxin system